MEIIYPHFCYFQAGLLGYDPSEEQSCSEEEWKTKFKPNVCVCVCVHACGKAALEQGQTNIA